MDVIDRTPGLAARAGLLRQQMQDARLMARQYTRDHGEDLPEVNDWSWSQRADGAAGLIETGSDNV